VRFVSPKGTSYLTHDDTGNPLAIKSWTGTVAYYVLDGAGSPIALIKADGTVASTYDYDPNGVATDHDVTDNTLTALNPYRYAGGMYDRTSDYVKFGQRWYNPVTGRFTQQDSIENLADPSRANRYEYAGSNPINYVDPRGTEYIPGVLPENNGCRLAGGQTVAGCVINTPAYTQEECEADVTFFSLPLSLIGGGWGVGLTLWGVGAGADAACGYLR
jgi:RHS repeat-associated protein